MKRSNKLKKMQEDQIKANEEKIKVSKEKGNKHRAEAVITPKCTKVSFE